MSAKVILVPAFVALLLAVAAFGESPPTGAPGAAPPAVAEKRALEAKLVEPGAEPRRALRLTPAVGAKQSYRMEFKTDSEMSLGGAPMPSSGMPVIVLPFETEVKEIRENGDILYTLRFGKPDVKGEGAMVDMLRPTLAGVDGLSNALWIDSRGAALEETEEAPPPDSPDPSRTIRELGAAMDEIRSPLPKEPVGVGAKWEVRCDVGRQGMKIAQVATYTLLSLQEAALELGVEVRQTGEPQQLKSDMLPGMVLNVKSIDGSGKGTMKVDTALLAPKRSEQTMTLEMLVELQPGMEMKMKSVTTSLLESVEPKPAGGLGGEVAPGGSK